MRQRLARAKKLLDKTAAPLKSIAAETGFCHAAYLIRSFRRAFGTTPKKYRGRAAEIT